MPLRGDGIGIYVLSVGSFEDEGRAPAGRGRWRDALAGLETVDDPCELEPPQTFTARKAVALGGSKDPSASDPKNVATKLHGN